MNAIRTMAALTLLAVPALASAQSSVSASAAVATYTNLTGTSAIAFGTLDRTALNSIDPAGGAGSASRSLEYNQNLTITYTSVPTNLTATVNSATVNLPVSLTCAYRIGAAAWSAASACGGASFDMDVGSALTTGTLGFGGDITAASAASALAATYQGTMTVVVTAR